MNKELREQVESAQAEMATWSSEKRAAVQLEGYCPFYEKQLAEQRESDD